MENFMVNIALPAGLIMAAIAVLLFIGSLLIGILQNLKGSYKLLISLGVILLTFTIGYASASDYNPTTIELSANIVRFVSAGIITMIALLIVSLVCIVGMAIYNLIK